MSEFLTKMDCTPVEESDKLWILNKPLIFQSDILGKHGPNLLEDAPGCLISDAEFPFQLFSRDTTARRGHQEHGMEPKA